MRATLNFDGAIKLDPETGKANPGGIAIASWILGYDGRKEHNARVIGRGDGATNNVAEWTALVDGLERLKTLGIESVSIFGDSQLVVYRLTGRYKIKAVHLKPFKVKALGLLDGMQWDATWIPREKNTEADELCEKLYRRLLEESNAFA